MRHQVDRRINKQHIRKGGEGFLQNLGVDNRIPREGYRFFFSNVEEPTSGHSYWPDLDVDLTAEIIEHPDRFPNKAR
jgi:hypothetical protein